VDQDSGQLGHDRRSLGLSCYGAALVSSGCLHALISRPSIAGFGRGEPEQQAVRCASTMNHSAIHGLLRGVVPYGCVPSGATSVLVTRSDGR